MAATPTSVRYRVAGWLMVAAALSYLCRNSISVAESTMRADLGLASKTESGYILGAFFWTYAFFQVPAGIFSQRYGTRLSLTLFAIFWSIAMFATAASPIFWVLIAAQLLMGIAQAGIFPASTDTINHWMPMSQRSLGCGLLAVGMQSGAILASVLTGYLLEWITWRQAFALFSIPGILWAIAFYVRFRDKPELSPLTNEEERRLITEGRPPEQVAAARKTSGKTDWGVLVRHPGLWMVYGQQICRSAGYIFFASWFPTYLQETRNVSISTSGLLQGLVFGGALLGGLFGGLLTDWLWRRTGNLWISRSGVGASALAACGVLILMAWKVEHPLFAVLLLSLGVLFAMLAGPAMFSAVIDISGPNVPQVLGAVNMSGNLAVAVTPAVVGYIADKAGWDSVLALFALLYFIGAFCWLFVNPRMQLFAGKSTAAEFDSGSPEPIANSSTAT